MSIVRRAFACRLLVVTIFCASFAATAQTAERPRLDTNEAYVEEAMRTTTLKIGDPMAVFAYVLGSLPDRPVRLYQADQGRQFLRGVRPAGRRAGLPEGALVQRDGVPRTADP